MDWSKAKNILIILFMAINLVLMVTLLRTVTGGKVSSSVIENTVQILKNRNVEVKCEIPAEIPVIANSAQVNSGSETIVRNFTVQSLVDVVGKKVGENLSDSILQKLNKEGIVTTKFELDRTIPTEFGREETYIEKVDDALVFGNSVHMDVYADRVQVWCNFNKLKFSEETRAMIPANQVMLNNFTNDSGKLKNGSGKKVIISICYGYIQRTLKVKVADAPYIPVWRIIMDDGSARYFKAFTAEEILP